MTNSKGKYARNLAVKPWKIKHYVWAFLMFRVGRENKLGWNLESRKERGIILLDGFFVF